MNAKPSSAHRWMTGGCTASIEAERKAPKPPPSESADEGTRLHDVAASLLLDPEKRCDPEDWEIVRDYVEDVRATHAELGGELEIEVKVEGGGIADARLTTHNRLILWDLKCGWRPVEVVENAQLLVYAIRSKPGNRRTTLVIAQPRVFHPDGRVRSWDVPDLSKYEHQYRTALQTAQRTPMFNATPSNCLYCRAVTSCHAARSVTLGGMDMAYKSTGGLPPAELRTELVTLRNVHDLCGSRLAALEAEIEQRLRRGEYLRGCALRPSRAGTLSWTADPERVKAACAVYGANPVTERLRTPKQMIESGVPEEMVCAMSERNRPKLSVVTDATERATKAFS